MHVSRHGRCPPSVSWLSRIWKRGSWLRVDSTIVGVGARFKLKRGRLSLVFMGKDSPTPGVLLRVDHTKSKVVN
ncbi:unnamed protein product, partial [Ectocarpus sp. 12 AP-2014]